MASGSALIARHGLNAAQLAAFARDGFLGPVPVLRPDEVADLQRRVDDLLARLDDLTPRLYEVEQAYSERPGEVVAHFLGGWRVDDRLRALIADPRLTVPCAQALGLERLRFWHDQVFYKPPHHPGVVPWHQDYSYWTRTTPARHVTINVMLDDADEENGCVQYVPGSHRWGLLPKLPFDSPLEAIRSVLSPEQAEAFRPTPVPVPAGSATIHHSHTLHGSAGNHSARPRRAVVFNYMAADTRVADASEPLLRGVPLMPVGAVVDGDYFPVVLDLTESS